MMIVSSSMTKTPLMMPVVRSAATMMAGLSSLAPDTVILHRARLGTVLAPLCRITVSGASPAATHSAHPSAAATKCQAAWVVVVWGRGRSGACTTCSKASAMRVWPGAIHLHSLPWTPTTHKNVMTSSRMLASSWNRFASQQDRMPVPAAAKDKNHVSSSGLGKKLTP